MDYQSCGGEPVGFMGDAVMLIWQSSCVSIFCPVGNERLIPHVYIYTVYMIDKSSILLGQ